MFLYRDDHIAVVNKPSGLLVHRGWARDERVLMTEVRDALGQWVYPIHRLDRGTSGAVVFALSSEIARVVSASFEQRAVAKKYLALVRGVPPAEGVIDYAIPRVPKGERVDAVTEYRLLATTGRYSLVEARPRTGRLHQVRRHLKHISCPLIGDVKYGKGEHNRLFRATYGLHRLALHASFIAFPHPVHGETLAVSAPLPDDLRVPLELLGVLAPQGEPC